MNLNDLKDVKVVSVVSFQHECKRDKPLGANAIKGIHGIKRAENVVIIFSDSGEYGVGFGNISQVQAKGLVGKSLDSIYTLDKGLSCSLDRADHAIYDLIAKTLSVPLWQLFGDRNSDLVPVYDSSFYFHDLLPGSKGDGIAKLMTEVEKSYDDGHRAFKFKIGRGFKWMDPISGFKRDVDVLKNAIQILGKDGLLLVDANNSYSIEDSCRILEETGGNIYLMEEMFPETLDDTLKLKKFIESNGFKTLVADGESEHDPRAFEPYIHSGSLDVLQPDIRALGLNLQWKLAKRLEYSPHKTALASHCYGSHLGFFKMLMLGRGLQNFLIAEQDTIHSDLFDDSMWVLKDGNIKVPNPPGAGLTMRHKVFNEKYRNNSWVQGDDFIPKLPL